MKLFSFDLWNPSTNLSHLNVIIQYYDEEQLYNSIYVKKNNKS